VKGQTHSSAVGQFHLTQKKLVDATQNHVRQ
jgi:hypothetical protein